MPAELGLYAALAAIVAYAVTGGTSILVVGPAAGVAALSGSIIAELGGDADPVVLAAGLAVTSGVILLVAGVLPVPPSRSYGIVPRSIAWSSTPR